MPFNIEFTNRIKVWLLPNAEAATEGDEFTLSVAVELPIWLTLPKDFDTYDHKVLIDGVPITVTVYQDCIKYYFGDLYTQDHLLRYKVLRTFEAPEQIKTQGIGDRKYIEKLRSVVRYTLPVYIQNRDDFVLYQLRPHCEKLMEACNYIMEAERCTYHLMAWLYPYRLSFLSVDMFWISLYKGSERKEAFSFMGNAAFLGLNPPNPAVASDFGKVTTAIEGQDAYPDWWLYYCKAVTHYGQQNRREAVIESIIALEMGLSKFVRTKWKERGVSSNAIDRAKRDITLSMMANIELMALSEAGKKPSEELIGSLNKARKLRNDIVHEGKSDVSEKEASDCIKSVRDALLFVSPSIYEGKLIDTSGEATNK